MSKKGLWVFLIVFSILLSACGQSERNRGLEFPKTAWDMTPEQVLKAYGISKEEAALYEEGEQGLRLRLDNVELFGQTAEHVFMSFADFSDNEKLAGDEAGYTLYGINAYYADGSYMEVVEEELAQAYGMKISEYYHFTPLTLDEMRQDAYKESDDVRYWGSSFLKDVIPPAYSGEYKELWKSYQSGLNDGNWDFFKDNARMVVVTMTDQEGENGKAVSWNAKNLAVYSALHSQIDD